MIPIILQRTFPKPTIPSFNCPIMLHIVELLKKMT